MNTVSYSQYSIWASCPHAWKLRYVDKIKFDDNTINLIFGTAMHEVIQYWLEKYVYAGKDTLAKSIDLSEMFKEKFILLFQQNITRDVRGNKIFLCDKETLLEFYNQGCEILSYIQSNRKKIFPSEQVELLGIEYPIHHEVRNGVTFVGYIDILTRNTKTEIITVYDLKTSKSGWTTDQKKDPIKLNQILLYKKFISEIFNVPLQSVLVEYIILKRIVSESSPYPIPRVSSFEPANGKPSVNRAWGHMQKFLNECFDDEGNYRTDLIKANPNKDTCKYCVFRDKAIYCSESFYKIKSKITEN